MQNVQTALDDVRKLYEEYVGQPAPEISPSSYFSFPPGVDPVRHAIDEVEQLKRWSRQMAATPKPAAWAPPADLFAGRDDFLLRLEIPGVAREDVKVFLAGNECVVRGERKPPEKDFRALSLERPWGPFERRFLLPASANLEKVTARFRDGLLEIHVEANGEDVPRERTVEVE